MKPLAVILAVLFPLSVLASSQPPVRVDTKVEQHVGGAISNSGATSSSGGGNDVLFFSVPEAPRKDISPREVQAIYFAQAQREHDAITGLKSSPVVPVPNLCAWALESMKGPKLCRRLPFDRWFGGRLSIFHVGLVDLPYAGWYC